MADPFCSDQNHALALLIPALRGRNWQTNLTVSLTGSVKEEIGFFNSVLLVCLTFAANQVWLVHMTFTMKYVLNQDWTLTVLPVV